MNEVGADQLTSQTQKLKTEAERLDIMDKAAGVLAELLLDGNIQQQIQQYKTLLLAVRHYVIVLYSSYSSSD